MPTVAGQLSSCRPMGAKAGVSSWLMTLSTECSVSSLPKLPSVPTELSTLITVTMTTITCPASLTNSLTRSQVRSSTPFRVGR